MRSFFSRWLLGLCLLGIVSVSTAADVEVITLRDGRVLTGAYDDEAQTVTLSGAMAATIRVTAAQILTREPAGAAANTKPSTGEASGEAAMTIPGSQVDPAVLAPLIAANVPWASGDRILIIGDLLVPPNQPELALRIQEALTAGVPGKELVVFSMQNHGLTLEREAAAAREEMIRRPPSVVLILAGVGDVVALLPPPAKPVPQPKPAVKSATPPAPLAPPVKLPVPTAEAWRTSLTGLVKAAQAAGAAVVISTPAIVGDKPNDGPGFVELDAYAEVVRAVATETKSVVCDVRTALLARLNERNPKGSRESGVLSKAPGQLKPEAMDLCAGFIAKAIAEAVPRIPWTIDLPGSVFTGTTKVIPHTLRLAADQVTYHVTIDGSEPSKTSPILLASLTLESTALVRVLAIAKDDSHRFAQAWYMATASHTADTAPVDALPGLWIDHFVLADWGNALPSFADLKSNLETWWPNGELSFLDGLPAALRPATLSCVRYTGYLIAPMDGTYVLSITSDGAARLFLGSLPVIRIDREGAVRTQQAAVRLTKGYHALTLLYAQAASTPVLAWQMAEPGRRLQSVPDLLLCRSANKPGGVAAVVDSVSGAGDPTAPWSIRIVSRAFSGSTKADVEVLRIPPERLNIYITTDGSIPTDKSLLYLKPITVGTTTQVRALAISKAGDVKVTADGWFSETRKHAADPVNGETLPGLWTEHCTLKRWVDPVASIDTMKADFISSWPNGELSAFTCVPVHRWPNELFGMRWSGYFLAPVDGIYTFATNSDDATRIAMGPISVLRNDDMHPGRWQYGAVELTKGLHQLGMLYGQGPAIYTMEVYVGLSGQRLQPLPDLLLRRALLPPARKGLSVEPTDEPEPAVGQP